MWLLQVLLSRTKLLNPPPGNLGSSQLSSYKSTADKLMCALLPNSPSATNKRTKGNILETSYAKSMSSEASLFEYSRSAIVRF